MRALRAGVLLVPLAVAALLTPASGAQAWGGGGDKAPSKPPEGPSGGASGDMLTAEAGTSNIKITQKNGPSTGKSAQGLAPVDPQWKPPACWYEPVATPQQLKAGVDRLKQGGDLVRVTPSLSWGEELMVEHYEKGEPQSRGEAGYEDFNLGENGYFWRGVINPANRSALDAYECERNLFWQAAGSVPDDAHAPTPDVLAAYAYDKIKVPDTEVELRPAAKSTVNLPTWAWLDKGDFKDVKVRAELPGTGLWAETTAKPVSLHLNPGTADAETHPASGECAINDDGSIGAPYSKGRAQEPPPCGITYLRATSGKPYPLEASVTWAISWQGSGGNGGDLPDGTFETTQDINVQEIQSINR
ncbi:hypothetical protein [Streptomyces sp. NPDC058373]|uniref:hypothetical protein n=1 Tax=unclassified Streptomyces TaxID=2593676 RepID=UPI003660E167